MISVIIPAFNCEKTIGECIDSIAKQDYKGKYEIIVSDDGSTDGTKAIVRGHKAARLIENKHAGPAHARNAGAKQAKGDILVFTDSDCIPDRKWLAEMVKSISADIAGVQGRYMSTQKSVTARFCQLEIEERYMRLEKNKTIDWIGTYSAAYKKDVFMKLGGFDEGYKTSSGEDPDFSYKAAKEGYKMVFATKAIVYHKHPESITQYFRQKYGRGFWRVRLYRKFKEKIVSETYTPLTLKIEILALPFFSLLPLLLFYYSHIDPLCASLVFFSFFVFTIPLSLSNMKKDIKVGLLTPIFVFIRTFAFCLGLFAGFVRRPKS